MTNKRAAFELFTELVEQIVLEVVERHQPRQEFEVITVEESAKILGVSPQAVYDICKLPRHQTGFPFAQVTLGGKITIDKQELIRWYKNGGLLAVESEEK